MIKVLSGMLFILLFSVSTTFLYAYPNFLSAFKHDTLIKSHDTITKFNLDLDSQSKIHSINQERNYGFLYPNPSTSEVHFILLPNIFSVSITFYDILGREIHPTYSIVGNVVSFKVNNLVSGIYLIRSTWSSFVAWKNSTFVGSLTLPFYVRHR
jgi:hypothetical protein